MTIINFYTVALEVVTGAGYGKQGYGLIPSNSREVLVGNGYGLRAYGKLPYVAREVLTGHRVGLNLLPTVAAVVREVLMREATFRMPRVGREVLGRWPDAPIRTVSRVPQVRMQVAQERSGYRAPPNLWSYTPVPQLRMVAIRSRGHVALPHSWVPVISLREMVTMRRSAPPPSYLHSLTSAKTLRHLALQSRTIHYVPISANRLKLLHMQVLRRLVVPPVLHSVIPVRKVAQLVLMHREPSTLLAAVAFRKLAELVLQARVAPLPHSFIDDVTLAQLTLQERIAPLPHSPIDTVTLAELALQHVDVVDFTSKTDVPTVQQLALQERDTTMPLSQTAVVSYRQLALQYRTLGPLNPSELFTAGVRQLALRHRDTVLPGNMSQWLVRPVRQLAIIKRDLPPQVNGGIQVPTLRVQFMIHRVKPLPIDVVDPAYGRHVAKISQLSLWHRDTESPESISGASRFVETIAEQVVLGDQFDPPTAAASDATVANVVSWAALGDDTFPGKDEVAIDVIVRHVVTSLAIRDHSFPDKGAILSNAIVTMAAQPVVLGDDFPDKNQVLSELKVYAVSEFAALGDVSFPDPTLPISTITAFHLVQSCAVGDDVFPDPTIPISNAQVFTAIEQVVLRDSTLLRFPVRTDRRRPVVSVSIT